MKLKVKELLRSTACGTAADTAGSESTARQQRIMDLPPGLAEFIPGYLASRREELKEMMRLLAGSDFGNLAVLGHNIKGSGTSFGFPEISRIGAALQYSAEQMDTVAAGTQLTELRDYLENA
jgi:HPt (histidine-containing phosphotransfer) domain-containing protein